MSVKIALVAVEKTLFRFDKLFGYVIPEDFEAKKGMRVTVPFGRGNKTRLGVIFDITEGERGSLKSIISAADDGSYLSEEMLSLAEYMKETTFCTYYDAIRTMLPPGLSLNLFESYSISESRAGLYLSSGEASEEEAELLERARALSEKERNKLFDEEENALTVKKLIDKRILIKNESIKRKVGDEKEKIVFLSDEYSEGVPDSLRLSPKQRAVVTTMAEVGTATVRELSYLCGCTPSVVKNLAEKGILTLGEAEVSRSVTKDAVATGSLSDLAFSPLQQSVYDGLEKLMDCGEAKCALLHGVTGSGKTSVFIKLIEHAEKTGRTAVLLVPEIALTPQTVGKFQSLFGNTVAIIHSNLSLGQRADEYKRIKSGEAKIVIGTRSAVFAPVENIGIIVIDEEGEHTYKSDKSPRYHARDIAKQRCFRHKALLLLASATPSFDSYYNALNGKYSLFEMNERYSDAVLPDVYMVDMRVEAEKGNRGEFSEELLAELKYNLEAGEQSMLLLNRRGYHTYANCINCGTVLECPNCSIPLTYHKVNDSVICHYCGYRKPMPHACEKCGSRFIYFSGTGTQLIEDRIKEYFPNARVLRMDADTTMSKFSYEKRFREFADNEYDIMIGTQMIAKGLNFENVTLVGVLLIDRSLYAGDYLGYEKTFSLITQVVGRSGRGKKKGRAYIQTFSPDHYVLQLAAEQNYKEFYKQESEVREALIFPPYCDICMIGFSGAEEKEVALASAKFLEILKNAEKESPRKLPMIMLGPTESGRYNGSYRGKIIIKCRNSRDFRNMLRSAMFNAYKDKTFERVSFYADFNGEII